jgi:hypothetical protein
MSLMDRADELLRAAFSPARSLEPTDDEVAAVLARARTNPTAATRRTRTLAVAATVALAAASATGAAVALDVLPIGSEVPVENVPGKGEPRYRSERVIAANGETPVAGRWQLSVTESDQGHCISLELVDAYPGTRGEHCASSLDQLDAATLGGGSRLPRTTVVYGSAPADATTVRATASSGLIATTRTHDGVAGVPRKLYVIEVPRTTPNVELEWGDSNGHTHRPGITVPGTVRYDRGTSGESGRR